MESIINSGAEQKTAEYAQRIINGEDREKVMQGLGPVFRAAIDKKLENESLKLETEKSSQEDAQKELLRHEEEKVTRQKEIEEREIKDKKQIEILRRELGVPEKQGYSDVVNSEVYNFPKEKKQELKRELIRKIESLSDDNLYLTHITEEKTAPEIFHTQFKYNPGTGLNGTFSVGVSKETLTRVLLGLIDGDSPHRNQFGMFLAAIPKSELVNNINGRLSADNIETYLMETYPEMAEGKLPQKYNLGYFKDGVLTTDNIQRTDVQYGSELANLEPKESIVNDSEIVSENPELETEQLSTPENEDGSYTPDRLQTILGSEISTSNFSGTLYNIAQGMYDRYRTTEDSVFGPRYQNEIDTFIPDLKKAETVQRVAEIVSQLNDTLSEMVRNVEYGASAGIDNRDQEIKELGYLADDLNAFKNVLDGAFEYALFETVGKNDKNTELMRARNEIHSLRSTISNLVNILYDKADRLR